MCEVLVRGVPVRFPFEPYEIQRAYMERVMDCLQGERHGLLESPTGTGKTLCLLCASLAWLQVKKAHVQAQRQLLDAAKSGFEGEGDNMVRVWAEMGTRMGTGSARAFLGLPQIIYASRTHSQLTQAMRELKRSDYAHMKACVLGSRDQMCINPEVAKETDPNVKIYMCRQKVKVRSCYLNNRVEKMKDHAVLRNLSVIDIEDIVKLGETHKFCPYYMSKELTQQADIIFMPYNYLFDPRIRKTLGVELQNNVVILDEAHNVDRMCEESASLQIKSTDITMCIEEVTAVMKMFSEDSLVNADIEEPKDFSAEDLCMLKEALLLFESALDGVKISSSPEGTTFDGDYIFELLSAAGITGSNFHTFSNLIDKIVQFLSTLPGDGPFQRNGAGLNLFWDLLNILFTSVSQEYKDKMKKCFKIHLSEEQKKKGGNNWLTKATTKSKCRILNYWCFSPGFGMKRLLDKDVRCIIMTSGTLAPLKPLISELDLNVGVCLENPHVISNNQICVRILSKGPDNEVLNCNYQNRDNPRYINSVGMTVLNLTRVIPNGILIFFPSYPIMQKFQQTWQETAIWGSVCQHKQIYVEPKGKAAFNAAMAEYYAKINDTNLKGAIFMGVCRGKLSEGIDFCDANGRAVVVVGLPFPPLKDPRVVLKKQYLDGCHQRNHEYLKGDEWYGLEAVRAVNQAIGRVIRHKHDYGVILLLDSRFCGAATLSRMSTWIKDQLKIAKNFGEVVRDLRAFFSNAALKLPQPQAKPSKVAAVSEFQTLQAYEKKNVNLGANVSDSTASTSSASASGNPEGVVNIHSRLGCVIKKRKITLVPNSSMETSDECQTSTMEYIMMVRETLDVACFQKFLLALTKYKEGRSFEEVSKYFDDIFLSRPQLRYVLQGLNCYIRSCDKEKFNKYWDKMRLT